MVSDNINEEYYSLETTRPHPHNHQTNREAGDRAAGARDNVGNGRNDQNRVTNESNGNRGEDSAETTPILVGHVCAHQGHDVGPELVDCTGVSEVDAARI